LINFVIILLTVCILYVLSTMCKAYHSELDVLQNWNYAHRGLHSDGVPENSMEAFRLAKEAEYGIELDVHLLADGNLAIMHDSLLQRTTGAPGRIEDLTTEQLINYHLEGTGYTIPLFRDVLDMIDGAVPLIVEIKAVGSNYKELCEKACNMLKDYSGVYCMESFDPRCVYWLKKNRPQIIRGQLTENYFLSKTSKLPAFLKFVLQYQMLNFLTYPDFVAYRFSDRKNISNWIVRNIWKVQGVTWTLRDPKEHKIALEEKWIPIFENFRP